MKKVLSLRAQKYRLGTVSYEITGELNRVDQFSPLVLNYSVCGSWLISEPAFAAMHGPHSLVRFGDQVR